MAKEHRPKLTGFGSIRWTAEEKARLEKAREAYNLRNPAPIIRALTAAGLAILEKEEYRKNFVFKAKRVEND